MITLCTLFDHNYLDKGLAMYESLEKVCDEFELYVLAMSDKCYEILTDLNYPHIKPIKLIDFEDEELLRVKPTRKVGEYCWTCSSSLIRYVLMTYKPEYCTYIDADMYFYSDPYAIIEEMKSKNASVQVVGHRFNRSEKGKGEWLVGKYCVEFNTFKNDEKGFFLVDKWRNQCLEHCSIDGNGIYWGDQKYLDHWCEDYDYCIETELLGAGIAPWNIAQYEYFSGSPEHNLMVKCGKKKYPVIFYHFENIQYIEKKLICINVYKKIREDDKLVNILYQHYLRVVDKKKDLIKEKYGLELLIKSHPGVNKKKNKKPFFLRLCSLANPKKVKDYVYGKFIENMIKRKNLIRI